MLRTPGPEHCSVGVEKIRCNLVECVQFRPSSAAVLWKQGNLEVFHFNHPCYSTDRWCVVLLGRAPFAIISYVSLPVSVPNHPFSDWPNLWKPPMTTFAGIPEPELQPEEKQSFTLSETGSRDACPKFPLLMSSRVRCE